MLLRHAPQVTNNGKVIRTYTDEAFLGAKALLYGGPRFATITAGDRAVALLSLQRERFELFSLTVPDLLERLESEVRVRMLQTFLIGSGALQPSKGDIPEEIRRMAELVSVRNVTSDDELATHGGSVNAYWILEGGVITSEAVSYGSTTRSQGLSTGTVDVSAVSLAVEDTTEVVTVAPAGAAANALADAAGAPAAAAAPASDSAPPLNVLSTPGPKSAGLRDGEDGALTLPASDYTAGMALGGAEILLGHEVSGRTITCDVDCLILEASREQFLQLLEVASPELKAAYRLAVFAERASLEDVLAHPGAKAALERHAAAKATSGFSIGGITLSSQKSSEEQKIASAFATFIKSVEFSDLVMMLRRNGPEAGLGDEAPRSPEPELRASGPGRASKRMSIFIGSHDGSLDGEPRAHSPDGSPRETSFNKKLLLNA